jgi:hypothetical protein
MSVADRPAEFFKKCVMPLAWLDLGSIKDLLELPITTLFRMSAYSEDKQLVETFLNLHSYDAFSNRKSKSMPHVSKPHFSKPRFH